MLIETYGAKNVSFGVLFASAVDAAKLGIVSKEEFNREAYKYYDYTNGIVVEVIDGGSRVFVAIAGEFGTYQTLRMHNRGIFRKSHGFD